MSMGLDNIQITPAFTHSIDKFVVFFIFVPPVKYEGDAREVMEKWLILAHQTDDIYPPVYTLRNCRNVKH